VFWGGLGAARGRAGYVSPTVGGAYGDGEQFIYVIYVIFKLFKNPENENEVAGKPVPGRN